MIEAQNAVMVLFHKFIHDSAGVDIFNKSFDLRRVGYQANDTLIEFLNSGPAEDMKKPIKASEWNGILNAFMSMIETQVNAAALEMGVDEHEEEKEED